MTPHERYRHTNRLLAGSFDRSTTEEGDLHSRAGMVPLGVYDTGVGLAWPSAVAEPAKAINRLMSYGYQPGDAGAAEDTASALMSVMGGGLGFSRPYGAIGAGGRPRIKLSEEQEQAMLRMVYEGVPLQRIASELGVSHPTVSRRYREFGIEARGAGAPGQSRALPFDLDDQLARANLHGASVVDLASQYGVDRGTVTNALKRWRERNPDKASLPTIPGNSLLRKTHDVD